MHLRLHPQRSAVLLQGASRCDCFSMFLVQGSGSSVGDLAVQRSCCDTLVHIELQWTQHQWPLVIHPTGMRAPYAEVGASRSRSSIQRCCARPSTLSRRSRPRLPSRGPAQLSHVPFFPTHPLLQLSFIPLDTEEEGEHRIHQKQRHRTAKSRCLAGTIPELAEARLAAPHPCPLFPGV